jgi:Lamin Tail Domain
MDQAPIGNAALRTVPLLALLSAWNPGTSLGNAQCLAFTEIMSDPAVVADNVGEWFEVANYSAESIDLQGLTIDNGGVGSFTINVSLVVAPGGFLLFARSSDPGVNGGLPRVDQVYTGINLLNSGGLLRLSQGATLIDGVTYPVSTVGKAYACGIVDAAANDVAANWQLATTSYGNGNFGTPGQANQGMEFGVCTVTGVDDERPGQGSFLGMPQPNPSRSGAWIPFRRTPSGEAAIHVVAITGQTIRTLRVEGDAGSVYWDLKDARGRRVAPGLYWVRGIGFGSSVRPAKALVLPAL